MLINRFIKDKEKAKKVAHIAAGFVILIHAYEKYESGHGSYLFFAIFGTIFIAIAFFHHEIARKISLGRWRVFFYRSNFINNCCVRVFFMWVKRPYLLLICYYQFFNFLWLTKWGKKGLKKPYFTSLIFDYGKEETYTNCSFTYHFHRQLQAG